MTTCHAINRVEGDTGPDLYTELENTDLTGKTITLSVRLELGGLLSKPAIIDDAASGMFHFEWDTGDLVEGTHRLEYVIVEGATTKRIPTESTLVLIVRSQA